MEYANRNMITNKLNSENFTDKVLSFQSRQAGIGLVFDPEKNQYFYNAYCIETNLLKELFSCEYEFLDEAIDLINGEFGSWELTDLIDQKKGCGSCAAK